MTARVVSTPIAVSSMPIADALMRDDAGYRSDARDWQRPSNLGGGVTDVTQMSVLKNYFSG
jgi:hypothetical protein